MTSRSSSRIYSHRARRKFNALGYSLSGRGHPPLDFVPDRLAFPARPRNLPRRDMAGSEGDTTMPLRNSDVWFITGCSTGFGRELAKLVLDRGYRAVITARDLSKIQDLSAGHESRALALRLDVTDKAAVAEAVKKAEA